MDLRIERQQDGRHVGRRIGVRDTAAQRAPVADLGVANACGGLGHGRAPGLQDGRRRDVVVYGRGTDDDPAISLVDALQVGKMADVDQRLRLAQAQLHQRHQAVSAGDELAAFARRRQLRQRIVE